FESANPGVTVTVVTMNQPDFQGPKLVERITGANPVDLVFWPYDSEFTRQGLFADLLPFYKQDRTTPDDLFKPLTDMVTENGKLTAIPMSPWPLVVFYNKEWFQKANLPEPKGDWTWEQFYTMSVKLKEANTVEGTQTYGSAVPVVTDLFESLAQSNGSSVLSPDNSHLKGYLDSRAVTEAFYLMMKDMDNEDVVKKVPDSANSINVAVSSGNVGMGVGISLNYPFISRSPKMKGKVGVAQLPRLENGVRANAVEVDALSIVSASKQQQLAWKFIKDIALNPDSEFQIDWSKQEMLTSRAAIKKLKLDDDPGMKVFIDELNHAVKPVVYRNPKLKSVSSSAIFNKLALLHSEAELQGGLSQTAAEIDQKLAEAN
ncbi:MAG: sugar transporter substrate-binding protein, partial [Paenibacillaceae bacterium]|nr:sugar transporter substrate-binding protein [Paenibacillaceae bacterium]